MWKRRGFEEEAVQLINSDFRDLSLAGIGFGASFFGFFAAIAAMYVPSSYFFHFSTSLKLYQTLQSFFFFLMNESVKMLL